MTNHEKFDGKKGSNNNSNNMSRRVQADFQGKNREKKNDRNNNSLAHEMKTYRKSIAVRSVCLRTIYWFSLSVDVQWIFDFFPHWFLLLLLLFLSLSPNMLYHSDVDIIHRRCYFGVCWFLFLSSLFPKHKTSNSKWIWNPKSRCISDWKWYNDKPKECFDLRKRF